MPRTRDIRPGFFKNEILGECQPLTRLFFAGLWTIADREGRLEDRPKKIKSEILPYDECDPNALLVELDELGFIFRYEVEGERFIEITGFLDNQRIHPKEPASVIPEPPAESRGKPRQNRGKTVANRTIPSSPTIPTLPAYTPLPPEGAKPKKQPIRKTLVADDWQPDESFEVWLREKHPTVTPEERANELSRFKSYCKANGKTYADHTAALRNWFDSPYRQKKGASGLNGSRPATGGTAVDGRTIVPAEQRQTISGTKL